MHDLIAAEAKYHANCLKQFQRSTSKTEGETKDAELPIIWLSNELRYAASQGHVLELAEIWKRYCDISDEANIAIPPSFKTHLATFKEKLQPHVADIFDFIVLYDQAPSDRKSVLVPKHYAHVPIGKMTISEEATECRMIPQFKSKEDEFMSMVHVALKLRADILVHPPHQGFVVHEDDAIDCVPKDLYMFVRLLFGGQELFEYAPTEDDNEDLDDDENACQTDDQKESNTITSSKCVPRLGLHHKWVQEVDTKTYWTC